MCIETTSLSFDALVFSHLVSPGKLEDIITKNLARIEVDTEILQANWPIGRYEYLVHVHLSTAHGTCGSLTASKPDTTKTERVLTFEFDLVAYSS